jgi:ABC-type bacteriocin/lantibiotic exporter with double-glycine peptidase domain
LSQQDIFQGTLLENITMGNIDYDKDELKNLIEMFELTKFVQNLPGGYETILQTAGNRLPSKIKQSILLIRAFLGKRRLLLLEEPFLNLDESVKKKMMDFILKDTTATTIFTSSEISIAMSCDQIIHIEKGVVINQGSAQIVAASLIK